MIWSRSRVLLAIAGAAVAVLFLARCERSNPFDSKGDAYVPGDLPTTEFVSDTMSVYLNDTIPVSFRWSDAAAGGKAGSVEWFYFSWDGDLVFEDSVRGGAASDTITLKRVFRADAVVTVYMRARDGEGNFSAVDSAVLEVLLGKPTIDRVMAPRTVARGTAVSLWVSGQDDNGSIVEYRWALDGVQYRNVTADTFLTTTFTDTGDVRVLVKAVDDDGVESDPALVLLTVIPPTDVDTSGPLVRIVFPDENDTVPSAATKIYVDAEDPSGVQEVLVDTINAELSGETWKCDVMLEDGRNKFVVSAIDGHGNLTTKTLTVYYMGTVSDKTPPQITLVDPDSGATVLSSPIDVVVRVLDQSSVSLVKIGADTAEALLDNQYRGSVAVTPGADTIAIEATDSKGNTARETLIVFYNPAAVDTLPPAITIANLQTMQRISTPTVLVRGTALDPSRISSVKVKGVAAALSYPNWEATVALKHGYDTVVVVAVDSSAARNSSADSVVVLQNAPPTFVDSSSALDTSLMAGAEYTVTLAAYDADGDSLTYRILDRDSLKHTSTAPVLSSAGNHVTLRSYTASSAGTDTLKVTVRDSWGGTDSLQWKVIVWEPGSRRPSFTVSLADLPKAAVVGSVYTVVLTAQDPNDDPVTFGLRRPPSPSGMNLNATTGLVEWIPLAADTGRDSVVATVSDGAFGDTLRWGIQVKMYNRAPILVNPGNQTVGAGTTLQFALSASDADNDPFEFAFGALLPSGATLDSSRFSWTPADGDTGTHPVEFIVRERYRTPALADTEKVQITVTSTYMNLRPVLTNPGPQTVAEGSTLSLELSATDGNGDSLSFRVETAPSGATLVGRQFSWTPGYYSAGQYTIRFMVTDNGVPALSDSVVVGVTVTNTNRPPVFTTTPAEVAATMHVGSTYLDTVAAADPDDDPIAYGAISAPFGLTVGSSTGIVRWTPVSGAGSVVVPQNSTLPYLVAVTASDGAGGQDTLGWDVTLLPKWPKFYGGDGDDAGNAVAAAKDGGYVVCGAMVVDAARGTEVCLTKTNGLGEMQWLRALGGTGIDVGYSVQEVSGGGYVLCGSRTGTASRDLIVVRTNEKGDTLWTHTFDGGRSDVGYCVRETEDGGFVACGLTVLNLQVGERLPCDAILVRLDQSGRRVWARTYRKSIVDIAYSVTETRDKGFVFCGATTPNRGDTQDSADVWVVRTNEKGDTLWTRTITAGGGTNVAYSVIETRDGGFAVCGMGRQKSMGASDDLWLALLSAYDGTVLWERARGGAGIEVGYSLVENGDHDFVVCGATNSLGKGGFDAYAVMWTSDGAYLAEATFGSTGDDLARGIDLTLDGSVVIAGTTQRLNSKGVLQRDISLIKADRNLKVEP